MKELTLNVVGLDPKLSDLRRNSNKTKTIEDLVNEKEDTEAVKVLDSKCFKAESVSPDIKEVVDKQKN